MGEFPPEFSCTLGRKPLFEPIPIAMLNSLFGKGTPVVFHLFRGCVAGKMNEKREVKNTRASGIGGKIFEKHGQKLKEAGSVSG